MPEPILQLKGITKVFPGVRALDKVDFTAYQGEVLALIGENGAGKSTLMKVLGGVHSPTEGSLIVGEQEYSEMTITGSMEAGIGFIHQELNVLDNLDVAANVYLGREPLRAGFLKLIDSAKIYSDTEPYLKQLGLNVCPKTSLAALSIAQQQMVEIAKALSLNAKIIIMDEPTSSLTLSETDRLLEVVKELKKSGVTVIYISHRLGEIEQCADRVVALRDGQNAGELAKEDITHDNMVRMMVGREISSQYVAPKGQLQAGFCCIKEIETTTFPDKKVSFEIAAGEILGMAGLVGAGRSEVAQAVFGVDASRGGTVTLDGAELEINGPAEAIKQGIYLVPEDRKANGLVIDMTIRENITLPSLDLYSKAKLIQREAEDKVAIEQCASLKVKAPSPETAVLNLSGGNQQKVVLAKWLSLSPRFIIFDEPTRGIDVGAKAEIYRLMRELADSGVAILMISSDMEEVINISDRVVVMHEGRITGSLSRAEMNEESIMQLAVGKAS